MFAVLRQINFSHTEIFMLGKIGAYFALDIIKGYTPSGNDYDRLHEPRHRAFRFYRDGVVT